jgi:hypothetical protein
MPGVKSFQAGKIGLGCKVQPVTLPGTIGYHALPVFQNLRNGIY